MLKKIIQIIEVMKTNIVFKQERMNQKKLTNEHILLTQS